MGLLDDLGREVMENMLGGPDDLGATGADWKQSGLALVTQAGGLAGLQARLKRKGLANLLASWTGHGRRLPIRVDQFMAVFGKRAVRRVASQSGVDMQTAARGLAQSLPGLVDTLARTGESCQPAPTRLASPRKPRDPRPGDRGKLFR